MNREIRREVIRIRLSSSEKKKILENAALSNIPYSDYMRSVSLVGYRVKHGTEVSQIVDVSDPRVEVIEEESPPQKQRRQSAG